MQEARLDLIEFSSLVPIKALGMAHCRELLDQSEVSVVGKGGVVFEQGAEAKNILYVMAGEVELHIDGKMEKRIKGGTRLAKLPLEQGRYYQYAALALTDVICVSVDPAVLDGVHDDSADDWMAKLLQAKVLHRISPANIQSVFMSMATHHFTLGESVVRQGEEGEHFYIIREGRCQVSRTTRKNPEGMLPATLQEGDSFGEEALISGGKRNASVIMETVGVLMSLSRADFLELLKEPLLKWISYAEGRELAADGATWVDVRLPGEY